VKSNVTISSPRRVKATLMWPFAMVLTFILTAFVATAYFLQVQVRDRALSGRVAAVAKLVNQKLDKDTSLMRAVMHTMQGIPAIGAAFAAQDRDALLREAGPLFQTLRSEHRITHLYFNNPELVNLVQEIHDSLSVDLLVLVDKQLLPAQQWQHGLALLERQGNWDRFSQQVMVAYTKADIPVAMNDSVLAALRMGETQVFSESRQTLHLAMLPLVDSNGQRIGDMVVMRDITGLEEAFRRSITLVTFLSLLVGAFVLGLFYFALDRVERDYQRQHDLEHQLLRLDTEHARILQIEKLSALGTIVGEIAHQLNNPLVGVVNLAQLAQREADNPARTRELLAEIRHAGQDCHAFIASMLRFAKVSKFECHPTDMAQVVNETVLMFRQTDRRQIQVELALPDHAVVLMVDPILLRHALFNLLVNAAQATEGEGSIVISLQAQSHPETVAPGWVLSVRDHGKGIAPEILGKVFTPFFTTRLEGTGLGLPVVQHVALLHQGFVSVENLPEGGTQFAVWLPQSNPGPLQHTT
jgi:signal transduction histidine kinase